MGKPVGLSTSHSKPLEKMSLFGTMVVPGGVHVDLARL